MSAEALGAGETADSPERPSGVVVVLAVGAALVVVAPVAGLLWRAPWSGLLGELGRREVREALVLSVVTSALATAVSAVLGLPLAWVLARYRFRGRRVLRGLAILPMVLPPVIGGVALLLAFGRNGLAGQWLHEWFGLGLPFTTAGVVLAQVFVAMPFLVVTAEAAFRSSDRGLEEAARTLGAGRWRVFGHVTLPLVRPALVAGAVLCWARALGEFGATVTFAGSFPGRTRTTPLEVYLLLETRPEAAVALSVVLAGVSLAVLVAMRGRWLSPYGSG